MIIKSSTVLRTQYAMISDLAHETGEPIYVTKNGDGDVVVMSVEAFEEQEELWRLKAKLEAAERGYEAVYEKLRPAEPVSGKKAAVIRTAVDDCFGHFPALVQIMHTADKFVRNNDFIFFPDGAERREFSAEFMTSHFFPFQQKIKVLKKLWHLLLQNRSAYPILFVIGIR